MANQPLPRFPTVVAFFRGRPTLLSGPTWHFTLICPCPSPTKACTLLFTLVEKGSNGSRRGRRPRHGHSPPGQSQRLCAKQFFAACGETRNRKDPLFIQTDVTELFQLSIIGVDKGEWKITYFNFSSITHGFVWFWFWTYQFVAGDLQNCFIKGERTILTSFQCTQHKIFVFK